MVGDVKLLRRERFPDSVEAGDISFPIDPSDSKKAAPGGIASEVESAYLNFHLPPELEASGPPEARGLKRDQVKLMVSYLEDKRTLHSNFQRLPELLDPGDVVVINTSGTRNAALEVIHENGSRFHLHLAAYRHDRWLVELRQPEPDGGTAPYFSASAGDRLTLPGGGEATLLSPYKKRSPLSNPKVGRIRLWVARLRLPEPLDAYLESNGFPIRYSHVPKSWPGSYYQTVFAREMGSAEMPSAGRAFSPEVITQLVSRGILVVPLTLHTGVSSLEEDEPPYEEFCRIPQVSAWAVNAARRSGKRVIAVGTTVVRALETAADSDGNVHPGEGWTGLVVTPERGLQVVDGLLTGFHEPRSSHLLMLVALMGLDPLMQAYDEALKEGYLWHEFGDLHLILP